MLQCKKLHRPQRLELGISVSLPLTGCVTLGTQPPRAVAALPDMGGSGELAELDQNFPGNR